VNEVLDIEMRYEKNARNTNNFVLRKRDKKGKSVEIKEQNEEEEEEGKKNETC